MSLGRGFHWLMIFNAALTFAAAVLLTISPESKYPLVGRRAGVKMGRVARRRRCVLGRWRPCLSLAPGPDSRVAHCCHEHAGQSFGIPTEPPGSPPRPVIGGWAGPAGQQDGL